MIKSRIIQTTEDIKNPLADRRRKFWNSQPMIPAGTRFTVTENVETTSIEKRGEYGYEYTSSKLGKLIIASSEDVAPQTWGEMAAVSGCGDLGGGTILRHLLKLGRIGIEDFEAAAIASDSEEG